MSEASKPEMRLFQNGRFVGVTVDLRDAVVTGCDFHRCHILWNEKIHMQMCRMKECTYSPPDFMGSGEIFKAERRQPQPKGINT